MSETEKFGLTAFSLKQIQYKQETLHHLRQAVFIFKLWSPEVTKASVSLLVMTAD